MNILVNEIDDETKKKNAFCKNVSWEKKKSTYDFASFEKKENSVLQLLSLLSFSPPPSHHLRSLPLNSENLLQTLQNINKTKEQNKKQLIHGRRKEKEQISKRFYNFFIIKRSTLR